MFEFDKYERRLHPKKVAAPTEPYEAVDNISALSLLVWGEHCVECAAPACFQTCDLYQRRPDGLCRRFAFGLYKNRQFPSLRGYGAEVSFKKWAKLEARGNTAMESVRSMLWKERTIEFCAPLLSATGTLGYCFSRNIRWRSLTRSLLERLGRWFHRRNGSPMKPDVFLLEIYNPTTIPVNMQLTMSITKKEIQDHAHVMQFSPPFIATVTCAPGYSRHEFDHSLFHSVTDAGVPFDIALIPEADSAAQLVLLTADFVSYRKRPKNEKQAPDIKCIVWDLDNTLWEGVLLETETVQPKAEILELLKRLDERGILLSIASKNTHGHAWQRLEQLGIAEYFLHPQINWQPKSQNIKVIAEQLNIGLDTFAFVDDSAFEREEVTQALPMVACLNLEDLDEILEHPRFRGSDSADAKKRRRYYKDILMRNQKQTEFGNEYIGFLVSCKIELDLKSYGPEDFGRVAELVQRTNQLNFSGEKYTRDQLAELLEDRTLDKYVLNCADKYGSYGTVGFVLISQQIGEIHVKDFMLSCRVQGKCIEQAFFHHLHHHHNLDQASWLCVNFRKTPRNTPAQQVLASLHFVQRESREGLWLDLVSRDLACSFIAVRCTADEIR